MSKQSGNGRKLLFAAALLTWFVMNIRVAAGIGSTFERAVDGLVGITLVICVVFLALDFFQVVRRPPEGEGRQ